MSEFINNNEDKRELLKHMILELHKGVAPDVVRKRLVELLKTIPYDEVVRTEQELIDEGLPVEEVLRLCDVHTQALEGAIDQSEAKPIPEGHPADTFKKENIELGRVVTLLRQLFDQAGNLQDAEVPNWILAVNTQFNNLSDVEKHYLRKEYLLFPFLEKYGISGPPTVMWGKHDETRQLLKSVYEIINVPIHSASDLSPIIDLIFKPAVEAVAGMIMKEEEILIPMCMDKLTDADWFEIYKQTPEYGYCLYDPQVDWKPEGMSAEEANPFAGGNVQLPTGTFSVAELTALFATLPVDITLVDKNDKVRFFSLGEHRIFARNRAILGRDVRMCHPPSSVHVVDQILSDFKDGKQTSAPFWINFKGRFIYIRYYPLRDAEGNYLGTVEFTQDLTELRALEGEQRLLSYDKKINS